MVETVAIVLGILLLTIPMGTAYVETECYEQNENYLRCVAKSQERGQCEAKEISWYCAEDEDLHKVRDRKGEG